MPPLVFIGNLPTGYWNKWNKATGGKGNKAFSRKFTFAALLGQSASTTYATRSHDQSSQLGNGSIGNSRYHVTSIGPRDMEMGKSKMSMGNGVRRGCVMPSRLSMRSDNMRFASRQARLCSKIVLK